ncbi:hypothetical protein WMY93_026653 [Mugilogobius chulae]|uniref:Reverse transcriptase domain-containing protein n=1 Tax=Mugilogobius chulae TaxID=88201 RepID=A0AAW0N4Y0_9GOBI
MQHTERGQLEQLEKEVSVLEEGVVRGTGSATTWMNRKGALRTFMNERAKGALLKARITSLSDIDAPTRYFFSLERKNRTSTDLMHLRLSSGDVTSDKTIMRDEAIAFYSNLFSADECDEHSQNQITEGLPKLDTDQADILDGPVQVEELTKAVQELSTGRAPGIDGLPSDFYQKFWSLIGVDLHQVVTSCLEHGKLPVSCTRAILALLPKKGDLTLLKNWRPVSLLCVDYKILAKVLANRLKDCLDSLIHPTQTYCIPGRTIMENLFLIRDSIDLARIQNMDLGLLSIDQEKAFDRDLHIMDQTVVHWSTSAAEGGGGLSRPVPVQRGIRQGCPLSGMLYALAIEPLLHNLRGSLRGFTVEGNTLHLSAYADDVTAFITDAEDVQTLRHQLELYERASSARVNWQKCEGLLLGRWEQKTGPMLPAGLSWSTEGLKCLGVYLGSELFQARNWEGLGEKVSARLSRWTWVQPQLSYRGRALVVNNLAASTLWHRFTVLQPPDTVLEDIQKRLVDFFWGGFHWLRAAVLYLPTAEGGQGLVDISSRVATLRLQTVQRLLNGQSQLWTGTAAALLRGVGSLGYFKHLFLLDLKGLNLSGTSAFYQSVLKVWRSVLTFTRDQPYGRGAEEPLHYNPLVRSLLLNFDNIRRAFISAKLTRLADLRCGRSWKSAPQLSRETGIRSERVLERLLEEVRQGLPSGFREGLGLASLVSSTVPPVFPQLKIHPAGGSEDVEGSLLSFSTPSLAELATVSKKALYIITVKVRHRATLEGVPESRWLLGDWVGRLGLAFTAERFIFGPKTCAAQRRAVTLTNFLYGQAKLSTWLTRRNQMRGSGSTDCELMLKRLVAARLKVEFSYSTLVGDLENFEGVGLWGECCVYFSSHDNKFDSSLDHSRVKPTLRTDRFRYACVECESGQVTRSCGEHEWHFNPAQCRYALGMEDGTIPDSDISASSAWSDSTEAKHGRLSTGEGDGAWCPAGAVYPSGSEYLQVDLRKLHFLALVGTQGRHADGHGREFARSYRLRYSRDGVKWITWRDRWGQDVVQGNENTYDVVLKDLGPPIVARMIRAVRLRLERWTEGVHRPSGSRHAPLRMPIYLNDSTYDGSTEQGMQFGGLGQLCDGVLGGDDFIETKELRVWPGYDYLGWSREALGQPSVDIEFHFEKPRVFISMQQGKCERGRKKRATEKERFTPVGKQAPDKTSFYL